VSRAVFPHYELEDVVQHVHLELCALFGPDYPRIVLRAFSHGSGNGGDDDPAGLRRAFQAAVARTVGTVFGGYTQTASRRIACSPSQVATATASTRSSCVPCRQASISVSAAADTFA
jgi:hypothetical protein